MFKLGKGALWRLFKNMKKIIPLIFFLSACGITANDESEWHRVMVRGSLKTPDPVLREVQRLEKLGQVRDVVILESYPLQIWFSSDLETVEKLKALSKQNSSTQ
ncbi:hypothetical protein ACJJIF_07705 [Microbulbifer sp. SSSA002]|uniref:hypothetical protein n=1 Tax=unclassified Microbulbifer TaxID=2619833 RepID=UPI004039695E